MTHRFAVALAAGVLISLLVPAASPAAAARYIVVLEDGTSDPGEVASRHSRQHGASVSRVYRHALRGYAATLSEERVDDVRNDPEVSYVERDQVARATAQTVPWGITKIGASLSSTKAGDGTGAITNVRAYVIDSGIDRSHADLYVANHVNFAGGKNNDCNGHGTHVAGTVGARDNTIDVVGAAAGIALTGVKVLGCNGSGSYSNVIAGVDWVTKNAVKPATANMSLGGPVSQALDNAVRNSAASGVFYALSAGNDGANACNYSPARAGTTNGIATVAATTSSDTEASWSNYGSCVDIWAPGVSILSTRRGGGSTTMSGTSMASPHVAGGGAVYLSSHTADGPSAVEGALKSSATTTGTISKDGRAIIRAYVGGF